MKFQFLLINHAPQDWHLLSDLLRPILDGLMECGHSSEVSMSNFEPGSAHLFLEYFVDPRAAELLRMLQQSGVPLGLVLTEDVAELQQNPCNRARWNGLQEVFRYFSFFWSMDRVDSYWPFVPKEKIKRLTLGSYETPRFNFQKRRHFPPRLDFLFYGRETELRLTWKSALDSLGHTAAFSIMTLDGGGVYAMPDYMTESALGSAAVLLDVARGPEVTMASPSRLAFALQHALPIITDFNFDLSGTIYDGYVERARLQDVLQRSHFYLSPEFAAVTTRRSAEWRDRFRMRDLLQEPLSIVPQAPQR